MERPRPVPPYLRLVVPSACWNDSKITRCLSFGMPIPESVTEKASTLPAVLKRSLDCDQPEVAREILNLTEPLSVNLNAFDSRFLMICCSRLSSVYMPRGKLGSNSIENSSFLSWAIWEKMRFMVLWYEADDAL